MGGCQVAMAAIGDANLWGGCSLQKNDVALWRGCGLREDLALRTMLFWIDGL